MATMNYFDSDMSNSTNTVVHLDEKGGNLFLHLQHCVQTDPAKNCLDSCISNSGTEPDCTKARRR